MAKLKKALVTGGAGFIGSHLCGELLARRFHVTVIDNFATSSKSNISHLLKEKNFKFLYGTIMDIKLMDRLIKNCDVVYHLAAAVGVEYILDNPIDSLLTNIEGTHIILKLADKYRKKVVIASTSEVYGKQAFCSPISENSYRILGSTNISRWSYSEGKAIDEFLALAYAKEKKLRVIIARFFNTVGPRQVGRYGMVLPRFIKQALSGKPIAVYGNGSQIRSFTYVKDAVRAIVDLIFEKKAEGEIFNIGSDEPVTIQELAMKVKQITNSKSEIKYISYEEAFGDKFDEFEEIECRMPNISKIKNFLNFQLRYNINDIISNTVNYFLEQKKRKKVHEKKS